MNKTITKIAASCLTVFLAGVSIFSIPGGQPVAIADNQINEEQAQAELSLGKHESTAAEHDVHAVAVNGEKLVYLETEEKANAVIDGIFARYTEANSEIISAEFVEDVQVVMAENYVSAEMAAEDSTVSETYLCEVEEAITYILNGTSTPKTHVVQGGDTLWDIAIENNISVSELEEMNPGLNGSRLSIGQVINLYEAVPFVTVNTVEIASEVERIQYDVVYTESADLYKGQSQVTSAGSYGSKTKKVEYVKENGVVVSSTVLEEQIISEPVTQYTTIGTTTLPIKTGSGTLQAPLATTKLSSNAGVFGASRGNRRHAGADLKGAKGDPIYAADAGTVIFSGYSGTYGYLVKIDHGNGIETRYSHCNTLNVEYGQNVEKGQVIATVGKSGNATGYLLHFEVRINGVAVDPLNYI